MRNYNNYLANKVRKKKGYKNPKDLVNINKY